jgi:hypothetical protein
MRPNLPLEFPEPAKARRRYFSLSYAQRALPSSKPAPLTAAPGAISEATRLAGRMIERADAGGWQVGRGSGWRSRRYGFRSEAS